MDEANFLQSKNGASSGEDQGRAYAIYTNAKNRLKSRFLDNDGEVPGKVWLISSKRTHASFLESHIKLCKDDISTGRARLYEYNQWEVRDQGKFRKPKFRVELGDRIHPSRILEHGEDPRPGSECVTVPGEYFENFDKDIDGAIRDIAGKATESICPLLQDKTCLYDCISKDLHHPFTKQEISTSTSDDIAIASYFDPTVMFQVRMSQYVPRLNPDAPRYIHVDVAFTEDSMGIACVHQSGIKVVTRARPDGTSYEERVPEVTVDFVLRITPPKGGEIDLSKMRSFIISLRDMGLPVYRISLDGYQSKDTLQIFRKIDFDAVLYSVDRTDEAYMSLRQAFTERRLKYYEYETLIREMSELERNIEEGKVDHPKISPSTGRRGGKDVADALAGAVFNCMADLNASGVGVSGYESGDNIDRKLKLPNGGELSWEQLEKDAK